MASTAEGLARVIAEYATTLDVGSLPRDVIRATHTVFADTCASMVAGSQLSAAGTAFAATSRPHASSGPGSATVVTRGRSRGPEHAALLNGIAAHSVDLDDSHAPSRTHPSAVIIPAALAACDAIGDRTGADLIGAIVVGYDVTARLSKAMGTQAQFDRGFHAAPVCGAVGAAVAAGRALRLSTEQMSASIALGASQSSGLLTYEDDSTHTLNSFHTGVAARNGLTAGLLAEAGYPAAPDVFTGRHSMLTAFSAKTDVTQLVHQLGQTFEITDTTIKRHACCGQAHSAVDVVISLRDDHGVRAEDVERIDVELAHDALRMLDGTPLATHNIHYVLSLAMHEGRVGPHHFSEVWRNNPSIQQLATRVHATGSDALQARMPRHKGAVVSVHTRNAVLTRHLAAPRGNPEDPLTSTELRAKFESLCNPVIGTADGGELWALATSLADQHSLQPLMRALGAGPKKQ